MTEISALGHPQISTTWKDGRLTLPATTYGRMQSRVFLAPRADRERAALDWFRTQSAIWRALPPLPASARPAVIAPPDDQLPVVDGWKLSPNTAPADMTDTVPAWVAIDAPQQAWKNIRIGAFGTLGLANDATGRFRSTMAIPKTCGRQVSLVFDAEYWFWGLFPQARLWINGVPAALPQPMMAAANPCFSLDVTIPAATGTLVIALEIDGSHQDHQKAQTKPTGVTGIFYLEANATAVRSDPLPGPWLAAKEFNVLTALPVGKSAEGTSDIPPYAYLQTTFRMPAIWPTQRVFIESDGPLGCLILNNRLIETPGWMKRLDVTNLVHRDGVANVLRWSPVMPNYQRLHHERAPSLRLSWQP